MRIFVGEYVTGGGLADQALEAIPSSLRREGAAMLQSIVSDLAEVAETVVPLDPRFANAFSSNTTDTVDIEAVSSLLANVFLAVLLNFEQHFLVSVASNDVDLEAQV